MADVAIQPLQANLIDDEIMALRLQLDEVNSFENPTSLKGKYRQNSPPDDVFAFEEFQAEVLAHLNFMRDLRLAHSIANAVDADAQLIAELTVPDVQAQEDRRFAIRLYKEEGGMIDGDDDAACARAEISCALSHCLTEPEELKEVPEAGPSMTYAQRQAQALGKLSEEHPCDVCYGDFRGTTTIKLPCGDRYCRECLDRLFRSALQDEDLFPPRCCRQPIPIDMARKYLSSATIDAFFWAEIEFSVSDRTYCSNTMCGKFIAPDRIADGVASCAICLRNTCTTCKNVSHPDSDCPADPHIQTVLSLGQEQGWRRCYSCRTMVELDYGCNHMTCKCRAQFCYLCGARWKTCRCDQWNEERLVARARAVVDREAIHQVPLIPVNLQRQPPIHWPDNEIPVEGDIIANDLHENIVDDEIEEHVEEADDVANDDGLENAANEARQAVNEVVEEEADEDVATLQVEPVLDAASDNSIEDRIDRPAEWVEPFAITDLEVDRLVREMAETLRANHECRHRGWLTRIEGMQGSGTTFQCEMCSRRHSKFILRCPRCHIEICAGCRRNRLR